MHTLRNSYNRYLQRLEGNFTFAGFNFSRIKANGSRALAREPLALIREKLKPAKVKLPKRWGQNIC